MSIELPARVVELLAREISRSHSGDPAYSSTACRALQDALGPHVATLAERLAPCERRRDGTLRFYIPRNVQFEHPHLPASQLTVTADFDPVTGVWSSDVASGQAGLTQFAGHVWRVKGGTGRTPDFCLLALLGLAYLFGRKEGRA